MGTLLTFQNGFAVQLLKKRGRNKTKMIRMPFAMYKPRATRVASYLGPAQLSVTIEATKSWAGPGNEATTRARTSIPPPPTNASFSVRTGGNWVQNTLQEGTYQTNNKTRDYTLHLVPSLLWLTLCCA